MMTPNEAKQFLLEQGITQTELARKLGVDRQDVTDVLNGRVKGHFGAAHKVAEHHDPEQLMSTLTPDQAKQRIFNQGMTISGWARVHGYKPRIVSCVLNGQIKGRHGLSHEIAVKLGLKSTEAA